MFKSILLGFGFLNLIKLVLCILNLSIQLLACCLQRLLCHLIGLLHVLSQLANFLLTLLVHFDLGKRTRLQFKRMLTACVANIYLKDAPVGLLLAKCMEHVRSLQPYDITAYTLQLQGKWKLYLFQFFMVSCAPSLLKGSRSSYHKTSCRNENFDQTCAVVAPPCSSSLSLKLSNSASSSARARSD